MISNLRLTQFKNGFPILNSLDTQNFGEATFKDTLNIHELPIVQKDKIQEL
jgi:hypothetical protein